MTIYDIFFFGFSIIYLPYLVIKSKAHEDFAQRFGWLPSTVRDVSASRPLWIHAVSVGEVIAAKNFIEELAEKFPGRKIVLSTTTKTGSLIARKIIAENIPKFYFPLDFSFVVRRALDRINPSILIVMETEIWPNLILELSGRKIPVVFVNGRISERSYRGYRRIKFLFGRILKKVTLFSMQAAADAERIIALGAPRTNVKVTGNMKFDTNPPKTTAPPTGRNAVGENGELIIAGSTHSGEEEVILDAYSGLAKEFGNLRLLIAPRHIDRVGAIKKLVWQAGFIPVLLSEVKVSEAGHSGKTVFILDTHGELSQLYSIATIVVMGGSLIKRGGHNIVEPARFGKPIIFGSFMFNFRDMARLFLENEAALQVKDATELICALRSLLKDRERRDSLGRAAKKLIDENTGATERNIREVCALLA
ncbi:MAG: 3-deoxy-D-manno-octulosonic acid transferase [Omnitrophica bacterium]|nr:3-deoxy-D-manno-octulosonic acid transferase [Candidatus Omnitrophota bacterium]